MEELLQGTGSRLRGQNANRDPSDRMDRSIKEDMPLGAGSTPAVPNVEGEKPARESSCRDIIV
jgi:hypothetical protein